MTRPGTPSQTRRQLAAFLALALLAALAIPAAAPAAPADAWASVSATLYDLAPGMEPTLVISGLMPEGTELPVETAIALPKGATVSWAGELTGDAANDPLIQYTIEPHDTYDLAVFTLTTSPAAQFELVAPEGTITSVANGLNINLVWTSGGTAERARVAVSSGTSYHMENVSPEPTVEVRDADILYWVEAMPVAAEQQLSISGTLVDGPAPELTASQAEATATAQATATAEPVTISEEPVPAEASPNLMWVIIGSLLVVIAIILVVIVRKVRESGAAE